MKRAYLILFAILLFSCGENYYFDKALELEKQGKYEEAITYLGKVIEKNPKNYEAYINRGVDKAEIGNIDGAIEDYTLAISIDSTQLIGYMNRGGSYINSRQPHNFSKALDDYQKALEIYYGKYGRSAHFRITTDLNNNYSIYDILLELGLTYYCLGKLYTAIDHFSYCIEDNQHYAESLYWRGVCYGELGMVDSARADLAHAVMLGYEDAKELFKKYSSH